MGTLYFRTGVYEILKIALEFSNPITMSKFDSFILGILNFEKILICDVLHFINQNFSARMASDNAAC